MTAIAVMQCVERGQIGLDDPVGAVFPELAEIEIIEGFEDDGKPKTRKAEEKLTLRCVPSLRLVRHMDRRFTGCRVVSFLGTCCESSLWRAG